MSVYVVTKDQRLLQYDSPAGKANVWIRGSGDNYFKIYWKECPCDKCVDPQHDHLIAYVRLADMVSIGFTRPVTVEGRMMTANERQSVTRLQTWLTHAREKNRVPAWMTGISTMLEKMLK